MSEPSDDRAERLLQEIHDALVIRKKTGDEHAPTRVVAASLREAFNAGRSSRDAEVAALELRASTSERRERERAGELEALKTRLRELERWYYYDERPGAEQARQSRAPKCGFDPDASNESCTCPACGSYRPCYPFGTEDPCLNCRERSAPEPKRCETCGGMGTASGFGSVELYGDPPCKACQGSGLAPAPSEKKEA